MTKAELIKALADIPDDADIYVTYKDDGDIHPINYIKQLHSKSAYLQTDELPTIENLQCIADSAQPGNTDIESSGAQSKDLVC